MSYDDIVVGAGHNGLAAAAYLARAGRKVLVLERADHVGGAAVSSRAFPGVDARLSRYSYLVSLLPKEVISDLELDLRLQRRRYASFTPLPAARSGGLLIDDSDEAGTRAAFVELTGSAAEFDAWMDFYYRFTLLSQRIFPTVLEPLRSAEDMRKLADDDELWTALTERPAGELIRSFFGNDTVRGIVASDALIGTFADLDDPSLVQNVCLLYHLMGGGTGDWDVPIGGMGAVTDALAASATRAGATIVTRADVTRVSPDGTVSWTHAGVEEHACTGSGGAVLSGVAPAVLNRLLAGSGAAPIETEPEPEGAQLKVNMLLSRLPRLRDHAVDPHAAFAGTLHINEGFAQLQTSYAEAAAGAIPSLPPLEIYCHSLTDRSILGEEIADSEVQTLTAFGLNMPARLFREDNPRSRAAALAATLRSINTVLDEPLQNVILRDSAGRLCLEVRSPVDLEHDLALPGGNIFHRSLQWPWAETEAQVGQWGVETAYDSVLVCGAGAQRGGGVSAIAGHNAAQAVLHR